MQKKVRNTVTFLCFFLAWSCLWLVAGKVQLCVPRLLSGMPCPGCGLTHAGIAFLTLDFKASYDYHPLFLPVIAALATALLTRYDCFKWLHPLKLIYIPLVIALMILYAVRMYYLFPNGGVPMFYDYCSITGKILLMLKQIII